MGCVVGQWPASVPASSFMTEETGKEVDYTLSANPPRQLGGIETEGSRGDLGAELLIPYRIKVQTWRWCSKFLNS